MTLRHAIVGVVLALSCDGVAAAQPIGISHYAHTAWRNREGFIIGGISSIAQTPDGYLWLGTEFGLLRFDGVRTVRWQSATGQHLASEDIFGLLASRDGSL